MKSDSFLCALLVATLLTVANASSSDNDVVSCSWGAVIHDALRARDLVVANVKNSHTNPSLESLLALINSLDDLTSQTAGLHKLDVQVREHNEQFISVLVEHPTEPVVESLLNFKHDGLKAAYNQGLGFMLKTFQQYQNFLCIHAVYSVQSAQYSGHELPLDLMCNPIRANLGQANDISADKVCKTALECSKDDPFWVSGEERDLIATACVKGGTKCKVKEALPIMGSLIWYKVSDFIADSLCYNHLLDAALKHTIAVKRKSIAQMLSFVKAYASTLTWEYFLNHALEIGAYSELKTAMTLVKKHEETFISSVDACYKIQATDVCIIEDIYAEYKELNNLKNAMRSPGQTRNLRFFPWVNHAKLMELKKKPWTKLTY